MIVADTNILIPLLVPGPNSLKCRQLHGLDPDWHLADWWQVEFANVLRNLHRAGHLAVNDALVAMEQGRSILPAANTHPVDLIESLRIACEQNISAYEARFIALSRSCGRKLVTEDTRLRIACPDDTHSLEQALALLT